MTKSEGHEVREAFDGLQIDHDTLIDSALQHNNEDARRASSAGESRANIKAFLEDTEINSQAYSWLRTILKKEKMDNGQAKAMDVIRSLEAGLPIVKAHVAGQGTVEMDLDGSDDDEADDDHDDGVETGNTTEDDEDLASFADDETIEFDEEVDEAMADEGPNLGDRLKLAYEQGLEAYDNGVSKQGNPFDPNIDPQSEHVRWNHGWTDAAEKDQETGDLGQGMENVVNPGFGGGAA